MESRSSVHGGTASFLTHHSPVGAWSSFTFGMPGRGVSIDHEIDVVRPDTDLKVALAYSDGSGVMMPFLSSNGGQSQDFVDDEERRELLAEGGSGGWRILPPDELRRTLSATTDTFSADGIDLVVYTPMAAVPGSTSGRSPAEAICPAVLIDVTFDNCSTELEARGYLGLRLRGRRRMRPLDWSSPGTLCGVALRGDWALASVPVENEVFTIRENGITGAVTKGQPHVHNAGNEGGIVVRVPPASRRTLTCVVGFYHEGTATQGIETRYWYTRYFGSLEDVCRHALGNAELTRESCLRQNRRFERGCPDPLRRELFYQAVRAYYANTQLVVTGDDRVLYNVCEGRFLWRNTLDLAADHLPWELYRNPWVVRAIADLAIDRYTYRDTVCFDDSPDRARPGGLTFTHDMGSHSAFSPAGSSGYERFGTKGYEPMTTEELLNGIYLTASYGLVAGDGEWVSANVDTLRELLVSLENRDHYDPTRRNGLLEGRSDRGGAAGEITTYDALDRALKPARGNFYIGVKTWCAALMLEAVLGLAGDRGASGRAGLMAARTAGSLVGYFDRESQSFPANFLDGTAGLVIAAVEPLGVPAYCGLRSRLDSFGELMDRLRDHARSCLRRGQCIDHQSGGLRLSSSSTNTWPSKVMLCLHVLEDILGVAVKEEHPGVYDRLRDWMRVSGADTTPGDQVESTTGRIINGTNYPRMVTSFLWFDREALGRGE